jgi:DNA-binding CsgD family transcriptional regulator
MSEVSMERDLYPEEADRLNDGARLAAILDQLPVAVALFGADGKFVVRGGALRTILGDVIPPRDPQQAQRWQIYNGEGAMLDPPEFPSERALRGETIIPGLAAIYHEPSERQRWLRVSTAPFHEAGELAGGIVLMQDIDEDRRGQDRLRDVPEARFADTLFEAIRKVCKDSNYLEPAHAGRFIGRTLGVPLAMDAAQPDGMTRREAQVLKLVAWGKSHKEIATRLGISVKTVEFHKNSATGKLRLRNRTDIVRYALSQHWLSEDPDADQVRPISPK